MITEKEAAICVTFENVGILLLLRIILPIHSICCSICVDTFGGGEGGKKNEPTHPRTQNQNRVSRDAIDAATCYGNTNRCLTKIFPETNFGKTI